MNCEEARRRMEEDPAAPDARAHAAACPSCARLLRELERIDDAVRSLPVPEPDAAFWAGYDRRLRGRLEPRPIPWRWIPAAAAVLVVVLLAWPTARKSSPPLVPPTRAPIVKTRVEPPRPSSLTRIERAFDRFSGTADDELLELARLHWRHIARKAASPDRDEVLRALALLERVRAPESARVLAGFLGDETWRNEAILRTVARLDVAASAAILGEAMKSPALQAPAIAACAELPSRRGFPLLIGSYPAIHEEVRPAAETVLARNVPLARRLLLSAFASAGDDIAAGLAPLAAALKLKEAAPRLVRLAGSRERRAFALDALARLDPATALRAVLDLTPDELRRFVDAGGEPARAAVTGLATDRVLRVARAGAAYLEHLGDAKGLLDALRTSPAREEIVFALARLRAPEALPLLLNMISDRRVAAGTLAGALAGYPSGDVVPRLIARLADFADRPRAHGILQQLTGMKMGPHAGTWERWWKSKSSG